MTLEPHEIAAGILFLYAIVATFVFSLARIAAKPEPKPIPTRRKK